MLPFNKIRFGFASAEQESAHFPELLVHGFHDIDSVVKNAIGGPQFLFLGYKGTGKSAIAEHLRLRSETEHNLLVDSVYLADFPFTPFSKIVIGDMEPEAKYPTAWSWLILLRLLDSFRRDEGAASRSDPEILRAIDAVTRVGLLPSQDLKQTVLLSARQSFRLNLAKVLTVASDEPLAQEAVGIPFFVERLEQAVLRFTSTSRHLLVIDGLDDILTHRDVQYQSLAALVLTCARLNAQFARNRTPAKVVLLCRTDLYERLPGANKNKWRQDCACELDWYHDPSKPSGSKLVSLANLRARLSDNAIDDVWRTYFPKLIDGKVTEEYLLEMTRHTPRDFLQALSYIQTTAQDGQLTPEQVLSGLRNYSIKYFLPEIKDELVGYVAREDIDHLVQLLMHIGKREFIFEELVRVGKLTRRLDEDKLAEVSNVLFECGAIGNIEPDATGKHYVTFKFRNRGAALNLRSRMLLHKGMWKALNVRR
jgi:hypothetical protein